MSKKPGSIASEAERLSKALGRKVTPDQVRWWRQKGYDLHDIPGLQHHLKNQQYVSSKVIEEIEDDDESRDPTVAFTYLTDDVISATMGAVRISDVLRYLRDEWEAYELIEAGPQTVEFRQRTVKHRLLRLCQCIGIDVVSDHRDMLCDEVFGPD